MQNLQTVYLQTGTGFYQLDLSNARSVTGREASLKTVPIWLKNRQTACKAPLDVVLAKIGG